jgi:Copper type II ascorbate-dependent monooxygenase, C-terminal domain/Copper type II ascorbate-dependent monooxygenase, N-terminal domain
MLAAFGAACAPAMQQDTSSGASLSTSGHASTGIYPSAAGAAGAAGFAAPASAGTAAPAAVPAAGGGAVSTATAACPATIVQQCTLCHDGKGTAGSPMGLTSYADLMAPSKSNPAVPVYKSVQARMHDAAKPMPPTGVLATTDLATVDNWVASGAKDCGFGKAATPTTTATPTVPTSPVTTPTTSAPVGDISQYLSPDGSYFIKEPPGTLPVGPDAKDAEFCFNLVAHNGQTPLASDTAPFQVAPSEFYHKFQFKVPYTTKLVALSTKPIIQNAAVLHHWLLFHVLSDTGQDGQHADEVLGVQTGSELLSGWAPGGNPPELPPGVGEEIAPGNGFMTLEFHYYNTTGTVQNDRSGVRICGTTKTPANVATLTWLGTESIQIPAHGMGTATGTCTPGGGSLAQDIHLVFASPHMHKLGAHMKTVINRKGGQPEVVLDNPFSFNDQREYAVSNVIHSGDTLTTTCSWMNTTGASVGFGESTTSEMCYNFVLSYPAHAMPNRLGTGLEGSSNMCLR